MCERPSPLLILFYYKRSRKNNNSPIFNGISTERGVFYKLLISSFFQTITNLLNTVYSGLPVHYKTPINCQDVLIITDLEDIKGSAVSRDISNTPGSLSSFEEFTSSSKQESPTGNR